MSEQGPLSRGIGIRSAGHTWKLGDIQRFGPLEAALGKHLQLWLDTIGLIQTADRDEHHAREALQITAIEPSTAVRTEISIKSFAGFRYVVKRFRLTDDQCEIVLRDAKERRHRAAGGPFGSPCNSNRR